MHIYACTHSDPHAHPPACTHTLQSTPMCAHTHTCSCAWTGQIKSPSGPDVSCGPYFGDPWYSPCAVFTIVSGHCHDGQALPGSGQISLNWADLDPSNCNGIQSLLSLPLNAKDPIDWRSSPHAISPHFRWCFHVPQCHSHTHHSPLLCWYKSLTLAFLRVRHQGKNGYADWLCLTYDWKMLCFPSTKWNEIEKQHGLPEKSIMHRMKGVRMH